MTEPTDVSSQAANAVQQSGNGDAAGVCVTCCKAKVQDIDDQTRKIAAIDDPIERNKAITKAYTDVAAQDPQDRWVKLASIVSAQGGCAMKQVAGVRSYLSWKQPLDDATGTSFTNNMYHALGDANKAIFTDIYPVAAYKAKYGWTSLKECYASEGKTLPNELKDAFDKMDAGDLSGASNSIAKFEQTQVVQPVYDKYSGTFAEMKVASAIQKPFTGKNLYDIPVSTTCGDPDTIPFSGNISNGDDRVVYYEALMRKLAQQQGW
ncbi:MAG TPA: DUF2515 family protein [Burkholderiaceae bacterium]